jgi:hypothetical protein
MFTCFLSTSPLFAGFTHGKIPKTTSGWSSTACCSFCKHLAWTFGRPDRAVNAVNVWNPVPQKPWEVSLKTSTGWQECYRICQCLVSGLNWQPTFRCACVGLEAVSFYTKYSEIFWARLLADMTTPRSLRSEDGSQDFRCSAWSAYASGFRRLKIQPSGFTKHSRPPLPQGLPAPHCVAHLAG